MSRTSDVESPRSSLHSNQLNANEAIVSSRKLTEISTQQIKSLISELAHVQHDLNEMVNDERRSLLVQESPLGDIGRNKVEKLRIEEPGKGTVVALNDEVLALVI